MISQTMLVADREIRERRFIFIAAGVAALLPYMAFLLPGAQSISRRDVGSVGVIFSIVFAAALALIVGGSLVGRELSERRLSFYFTRPLPASSIWFGKLLAGIVLVVISFTIIAVPAVLVAGSPAEAFGQRDWWFAAAWVGLLLALMLVGHTTSTMVRSRSPLVALDLALLAVASTLAWFILRELLAAFAVKAASFMALILAIGLTISAIGAGAWQLSRGRSEARRSHAALSTFFWPAVAVVLLITGGFVMWLLSAKPSDLIHPELEQKSAQWIYMTGAARMRSDYHPLFLVNAATGDYINVRAVRAQDAVSRDGRTFAFVRSTSFDPRQGPFELQIFRIEGGERRMVETTVPSGPFDPKALSDDGRLFAGIRDGIISVHDLEAKRLVVSARLPQHSAPSQRFQMIFLSRSLMRIYEVPSYGRQETGLLRAFELDLRTRKLTLTGETRFDRGLIITANDDASRLIAQLRTESGKPSVASILDGRTLQLIASIHAAVRPFRAVRFLRDGRIAALEGLEKENRRLAILGPDGRRLRTIEVAAGETGVFIAGEASPGKVVIALSRRVTSGKFEYTTLLVDIDGGRIARREERLVPAWTGGNYEIDPRQARFGPDHVWVLQGRDGAVWRWNPETGEKSLIVRTQV
jgi:hypothetical protein